MKAGENLERGCRAMIVGIRGVGIIGNKYGEIVTCYYAERINGIAHWCVEDKNEYYWFHHSTGLLRLPDIDDDSEEISAILPKTPPKINNTAKELL
jgi:hypothetical protein